MGQVNTGFKQKLIIGKIGESKIANWLRFNGWNILPVYEIEKNQGKGPQIYTASMQNLIAPDLLAFGKEDRYVGTIWVEAKHKTVFSWHRITKRWVTGIDLRHYNDYLKVDKLSKWDVWLFFLHQNDRIDKRNEPWPCPTGLFGQRLSTLSKIENHRHSNWGRSGMVYWAKDSLLLFATLDEIEKIEKELK